MSRLDTVKFEPTANRWQRTVQRLHLAGHTVMVVANLVLVAIASNTIGRIEHRSLWRRRRAGETIWLDDILAPRVARTYERFSHVPADISPKPGHQRTSRVMARDAYPDTDYAVAYRTPPLSGNTINGLGETEVRRAVRSTFFSVGYSGPWNTMERVFQGFIETVVPNTILPLYWEDRRRVGLVATEQRPVDDPAAMSVEVTAFALQRGAALAGVAVLRDEHRFEGFEVPYQHAISIAVVMDRERLVTAPSTDSAVAVQEAYRAVNAVAHDVAASIRAMGWPARACTNISPDASEVLHLPIAVEAGLGMLGKHGSLITAEHGSNVRLATILTDLPLVPDGPEDIGVDDFCASCQICTTNCPPNAIFDVKQMVRGVEKWYVDFDTCIPYFAENDNCGICIEVCPWSEPGKGPLISERMLSRRSPDRPV